MNNKLQVFSIFFLGICIVLGSIILSNSLTNSQAETIQVQSEQGAYSQNRYEFVALATDYFVMLDSYTGEYWMKIGADEWIKQESPQK